MSLVTSTKAHALLVEVDAAAALAIPGVVGFLDHSSVSGANATGQSDIEEIFATKEVCMLHQPVQCLMLGLMIAIRKHFVSACMGHHLSFISKSLMAYFFLLCILCMI